MFNPTNSSYPTAEKKVKKALRKNHCGCSVITFLSWQCQPRSWGARLQHIPASLLDMELQKGPFEADLLLNAVKERELWIYWWNTERHSLRGIGEFMIHLRISRKLWMIPRYRRTGVENPSMTSRMRAYPDALLWPTHQTCSSWVVN